ncbi:MAG TPA: ureidoglycolate lyase [Pseudorhodoferax sp.]|jgi:ureidoglycolate lyase|nr:ureidoglycolate lyase [Pseudorhodoferax sp.]
MSQPPPIAFQAEPLTPQAFLPFGTVVEHQGRERRHFLPEVFSGADFTRPSAWVSKLSARTRLPLVVSELERHAHSAQTFVPLTDSAFLVFVAGSHADGSPDLAVARAFIAQPHQGVCFRRSTWHFGLSPLADDAQFLVLMNRSSDASVPDDEFLSLPHPCEISLP